MKKILIFGATGQIGAYTALELKEAGYNVVASGLRESDNGFFQDYNIPYYSVNISNKASFDKIKNKDFDVVVNVAGNAPSKVKGYNPELYIDMFVTGTLNILHFCIEEKVQKIVSTHTRADSSYLMNSRELVEADIEKRFPLTGDHSIYTICKNAAVDLMEHFYTQHGLKRFIFRLPTIYDYHPDKFYFVNGKKRIMAYRYIIDQAIQGNEIEIWGDPSRAKEICYVKDLTQCIEKAIESNLEGGMYNFGRGVGVTIEEQIKGIVKVFSSKENPSKIIYRPDKPDSRQFIHDISKTRNDLGYEPKYDYISLLNEFKKEMELNRFKKLWGNIDDYE
ncbi:NAD-dependent epimerase/dehydratase family protein [Saccharicrinis sp. FJH62]|uniref:NAD-dependent epimerase/dehydratase family protein n=1 Tax=Saccharicrinis sp. FJH62 TaxID=3344657 RepID=UPI0035D50323